MEILLLLTSVFGLTGGVHTFNRALIKATDDLATILVWRSLFSVSWMVIFPSKRRLTICPQGILDTEASEAIKRNLRRQVF